MYSGRALRPLTVIRAVQWLAVIITGWSMSLRWGDEAITGNGPPAQWERHVVGATLLLFLAAVASSLAGRKGKPVGLLAVLVSCAGSGGAVALSLALRSQAIDNQHVHLLAGNGWLWMMAGGAMSVGAAVSGLTLLKKPEAPKAGKRPTSRKARR